MADGIAVEGIKNIKDYLVTAYKDPSNKIARAKMLVTSSMGSTAFQKGLGAIHALSHPVGAHYDTHHGLTNAVFAPYVLQYNRPAIEERLERLSRFLELKGHGYHAVINWLLCLREQFGIPHTTDQLGLEENSLEKLAEMAANDPTAATNPLPVGQEEMLKIYEASMTGEID